jgi:two-component system response regulator FixJ
LIYIVDDDEQVRESIARVLSRHGFTPHTFATAQQFLDVLPRLEPGCVLTDVCMPGMSGLELQKLLRNAPEFSVVLMTAYAQIRTAVEAIKNGAFEFIEKPFDPDALCEVLRSAVAAVGSQQQGVGGDVLSRIALLSPREREVFVGVVRGQSNKELARDLQLSPRTVESHRARVLAKMQARSTSELIRMGITAGLG